MAHQRIEGMGYAEDFPAPPDFAPSEISPTEQAPEEQFREATRSLAARFASPGEGEAIATTPEGGFQEITGAGGAFTKTRGIAPRGFEPETEIVGGRPLIYGGARTTPTPISPAEKLVIAEGENLRALLDVQTKVSPQHSVALDPMISQAVERYAAARKAREEERAPGARERYERTQQFGARAGSDRGMVLEPTFGHDKEGNIIPTGGKMVMAPEEQVRRKTATEAALATQKKTREQSRWAGNKDVDDWADRYNRTAQLPALGLGGAEGFREAILTRAPQRAREQGLSPDDVAEMQASYKADSAELSTLQRQRGTVMAFEHTAAQLLTFVREASQAKGRTGIPVINRWLQAGQRAVTGDPDIADFDVTVREAIAEAARILSTVSAGGVTAQEERTKWESLLNTAQTPEQVERVIRRLTLSMKARATGFDAQIEAIKRSLRGQPRGASGPMTDEPTRGAPSRLLPGVQSIKRN